MKPKPTKTTPAILIVLVLGLHAVPQVLGFYNSSTGRWLNRDPIGEHEGTCLYVFVNNAASHQTDVLGFYTFHLLPTIEGVANTGGLLGGKVHGLTASRLTLHNIGVKVDEQGCRCCLTNVELRHEVTIYLPALGDYLIESLGTVDIGVTVAQMHLDHLTAHETRHKDDFQLIGSTLGPQLENQCTGKCLFRSPHHWPNWTLTRCAVTWVTLLERERDRIQAVGQEAGDHWHNLLDRANERVIGTSISQSSIDSQSNWLRAHLQDWTRRNEFCPFAYRP